MARIRLQAFPAQFTPTPFQNLAYMAEKKQEKEEKGLKAYDDLESEFAKIGAIKDDRSLRDETLKTYRDKLTKALQNTGGNYAAVIPEINRIKREFTQDANYGSLAAIKSRYTAQQESLKELEEARKEWIKTGGKQGMKPEDYDLAVNAELSGQEPLEISPDTGKWTTKSGTLYKAQNPRYSPDEAAIALEYASKITPEEITRINPDLKQVPGRAGHFYNITTDQTFSYKDLREKLIREMMLSNPTLQEYYGWKNNLTGKNEKAREIYTLAEQGLGVDEAGNPIQLNPSSDAYTENLTKITSALGQELYPGIYKTAKAAGALTEVNKSKSDIQFIKDFVENLDFGGPGYNVYDRPIQTPGFPVPTEQTLETVKDVHVTASGDVPLKSPGLTARTVGFLGNFLKGVYQNLVTNVSSALTYGASPYGAMQATVDPELQQGLIQAGQSFDAALNSITNSDNTRQAVTKVTNAFRQNYPSLEAIPQQITQDVETTRPLNPITYYPGQMNSKPYTYDKNSGVVFNVVNEATKNMQSMSGKLITLPSNMRSAVEKNLVSSGLINYGSFSMQGAPYTEQVKEQLGELKDIKFSGIGDYMTGGTMIFTINGQEVEFKPSDQITKQNFPVSKAAAVALASGKRVTLPYGDGTELIVQPDIIPGSEKDPQGNSYVRPDGKGSQFTVRLARVDKAGKTVPFQIGNKSFPTLSASEYYSLFEFPTFIESYFSKK
jgi:hypothetical protein